MSGELSFINPDTVNAPFGAYSHIAAVSSGAELVFFSGQVGEMSDGSISLELEDQYLQTLKTIRKLLEAKGYTPANLVKLNTYLVRPMDPRRMREIRHSVFGDIAPAATLLFVPRLAGEDYLVEIDAIAAK